MSSRERAALEREALAVLEEAYPGVPLVLQREGPLVRCHHAGGWVAVEMDLFDFWVAMDGPGRKVIAGICPVESCGCLHYQLRSYDAH